MPGMTDKDLDLSILPTGKSEREAMLDSMSAADLANALEHALDSMTEETYDGELVSEFLDALDRKAPMLEKPDSKAAFAEFQERVRSMFDTASMAAPISHISSKRRKFGRVIVSLAAAVGILFILLIGAQASGVDVFGPLAQWTNEVFHFGKAPNKDAEIFNMINQTLEKEGFPEGLIPTWYPEGFEAGEPHTHHNSVSKAVDIFFDDGNGQSFVLSFISYSKIDYVPQRQFEKDDQSVEIYTTGIIYPKSFYIMNNINEVTATWSNDVIVETVRGSLSLEEVKTILDSIGDEEYE